MTAKSIKLLDEAEKIRAESDFNFSDEIIESIFDEAEKIAGHSVVKSDTLL